MSDWNPFANWTFSTKQKTADNIPKPMDVSAPAATELPEDEPQVENTQIAEGRSFLDRLWDGLTKETCPNCGLSGGQRKSRHHVGYEQRPGTVTQKERHYDRHGNLVSTTERDVHVMKRFQIFDQRYKCYLCDHEWERRMKLDVTGL
jgi:hypothetical protein